VLDAWRFFPVQPAPSSLAELREKRRGIDATLAAVATPEVERLGDDCRKVSDRYLIAVQTYGTVTSQGTGTAQLQEAWDWVTSERDAAHAAVDALRRRIGNELGSL
jgi:hypothetical protein